MKKQDKPPQPDNFTELLKKWKLIRTAGTNHSLLKTMAGDWSVKLVFHGGNQRWESHAQSKNLLLHGGLFFMEQNTGEIFAPDGAGKMRPEPYTATRILGFDNYKKAYCGTFCENQNSYLLNFTGRKHVSGESDQIDFYGFADEPMLELNDAMLKYTLKLHDPESYTREVFALTLGINTLFSEFHFENK